jgi:hypothetical protein
MTLEEAWAEADRLYEEYRKADHAWIVAVNAKDRARIAHSEAALTAGAMGPRPTRRSTDATTID